MTANKYLFGLGGGIATPIPPRPQPLSSATRKTRPEKASDAMPVNFRAARAAMEHRWTDTIKLAFDELTPEQRAELLIELSRET